MSATKLNIHLTIKPYREVLVTGILCFSFVQKHNQMQTLASRGHDSNFKGELSLGVLMPSCGRVLK